MDLISRNGPKLVISDVTIRSLIGLNNATHLTLTPLSGADTVFPERSAVKTDVSIEYCVV
jgi:hypothetical protein